jgi:hypothetical protein
MNQECHAILQEDLTWGPHRFAYYQSLWLPLFFFNHFIFHQHNAVQWKKYWGMRQDLSLNSDCEILCVNTGKAFFSESQSFLISKMVI